MRLLYLVSQLLLSLGLTQAEVVTSFAVCRNFFANPNGTHVYPTHPGNSTRYKLICQTYNNRYHYATLYDTRNRIPVYSAYEFHEHGNGSRNFTWLIEPQLDDPFGGREMALSRMVRTNLRGRHQALNRDYSNSGFQKGHLYPVFHANTQDAIRATVTLTNAAPQTTALNNGKWKRLEGRLSAFLRRKCARAFVVTGTIAGNRTVPSGRVKVPRYFWSSYCCLDQNRRPIRSRAYLGKNSRNRMRATVTPMTVRNLENILGFSVFQGRC